MRVNVFVGLDDCMGVSLEVFVEGLGFWFELIMLLGVVYLGGVLIVKGVSKFVSRLVLDGVGVGFGGGVGFVIGFFGSEGIDIFFVVIVDILVWLFLIGSVVGCVDGGRLEGDVCFCRINVIIKNFLDISNDLRLLMLNIEY